MKDNNLSIEGYMPIPDSSGCQKCKTKKNLVVVATKKIIKGLPVDECRVLCTSCLYKLTGMMVESAEEKETEKG